MLINTIKLVGAVVLVMYAILTLALEWLHRLQQYPTIKKFVEAKVLRAVLLICAIILLFGVFQDINAVREALNIPPPSPKAPQVPVFIAQESPPSALQNRASKATSSLKPPIQVNNAPNGFAISGGTVSNPTVNNLEEKQYPLAGEIPTISVCAKPSVSATSQETTHKYETSVSVETDTRITRPAFALYFDGTVLGKGAVDVPGFSHSIQGGDKNPRAGADDTFMFYVMEVGSISEKSWYPKNPINFTVYSQEPRILQKVEVASGLAEDINKIQDIQYRTAVSCPN